MTIPFRIPTPAADPVKEPAERPRKRGAPFGNQNARKHGLYSRKPVPDLSEAFARARELRGARDEIAFLRIRIKSLATRWAPNEEFFHALEILNRLLITHHRLMHPEGDPAFD